MFPKTESSLYITVRDGTQLAATVFYPSLDIEATKSIPVVWKHDRYHTRNKSVEDRPVFERFKQAMLNNGIAVALVDSRGSGASFGHTSQPFSTIEQSDMYDVTEWFADQNWCSGRIGMFGRSYAGISQYLAAAACPPHLVIIIPEMAFFDLYQFAYPGGIFRNDFAQQWGNNVYQLDQVETAKEVDADQSFTHLKKARAEHADNGDIYDLFSHRPYRDSQLDFDDNSIYETGSPYFYKDQIEQSGVVIFHVAGWQDLWVKDALIAFNTLNASQALMIGPWAHNGYCDYLTESMVEIFSQYLLDNKQSTMQLDNSIYYFTQSVNIDDAWRKTNIWPLKNQVDTLFYFDAIESIGRLTTTKPTSHDAQISYRADYATTSGHSSRWSSGYGTDVNYDNLHDLLEKSATFSTEPFAKDEEMTGHPIVEVTITSDSHDFDLFLFLLESHPDGYIEYLTEACLRASRYQPTTAPYSNFGLPYNQCSSVSIAPVPISTPRTYKMDLLPISKVIKADHVLHLCLCCSDVDNCLTPRRLPEPTLAIGCNKLQLSTLSLPFIPLVL